MKSLPSNREYAARGSHCPVCGSDEIEGDSVDISGRQAGQECRCLVCEAEWEDLYELYGYRLITLGNSVPWESGTAR